MITIIIMGILSGFFTIFLNYCFGKPGSKEFSPYEIFSSYTVWLSKKRLKKVGLSKQYEIQYNENIRRTESKHEVISFKTDFKKMLYDAADPFFTWERAVGMCAVCFGFWVSLITAIIYSLNIFSIMTIVVTSHVTIRILNKLL